MDRKTARRYVQAAEAAGVARNGDAGQLSDEVIGAVVAAARPARPAGHGGGLTPLLAADHTSAPPPLRQALRTIDQHLNDRLALTRLPTAT